MIVFKQKIINLQHEILFDSFDRLYKNIHKDSVKSTLLMEDLEDLKLRKFDLKYKNINRFSIKKFYKWHSDFITFKYKYINVCYTRNNKDYYNRDSLDTFKKKKHDLLELTTRHSIELYKKI